MSKVSIKSLDDVEITGLPAGVCRSAVTRSYFDDQRDSLHLHLVDLEPGNNLRLEPSELDRLLYVWKGAIEVGGLVLKAGSSAIVEHGESLEMSGVDAGTRLLAFSESRPAADQKAGGHVHLLPDESVPRTELQPGLTGGLHADSACPSCQLWLHENRFQASETEPEPNSERGIHSHSEDEIIFVTDGELLFGNRRCLPGTAIAISAGSMYSFTPGRDGLAFVNFRASMPGDIRFKNGHSMSETGYWRERVLRPQYLTSNS